MRSKSGFHLTTKSDCFRNVVSICTAKVLVYVNEVSNFKPLSKYYMVQRRKHRSTFDYLKQGQNANPTDVIYSKSVQV